VVPAGNTEPGAMLLVRTALQLSETFGGVQEIPGELQAAKLTGHEVITGGWLSMIVTVNEHVAVFPEASVTTKLFVVVPIGKVAPLARPAVRVTICPGQLSEEVTV